MTGEPTDLLGKILKDAPSQGTLLLILTKMKEEGRVKEVIQECLKALEVYPNDIHIRKLLAESYFDDGAMEKADEELEKVTAELANLSSIFILQAKIHSKNRRAADASKALKRYLACTPDDQEALDMLAEIKEEGFKKLVADEGGGTIDEIATPTLAEIFYNQGQVADAIKIYERVVQKNPHDDYAVARLAELKSLTNEKQAALRAGGKVSLKAKKEKTIAILEKGLGRILETSHA